VNATVAGTVTQRSGRARAIRNQGSRAVQRRRPQTNPRTPQQKLPTPQASPVKTPAPRVPGQRPAHLRLVSDHGRMIDPGFTPGRPVWVTGVSVSNTGKGEPGQRAEARPRREAEAAGRGGREPGAVRRDARAASRGGRRSVRLTRRGRFLVSSTLILLIAVASMVLAGAAHV
jgi:hypothetical protein